MSLELISSDKTLDFLWLDMEFTGLNPDEDVVIEVGVVATRGLFEVKSEYSAIVKHDLEHLQGLMMQNRWWLDRPEHMNEMLQASEQQGNALVDVADQLADFAAEHRSEGRPLYLAGNSIHNDRKWVTRDFPDLESQLHYRMLDVSSLKLVVSSLFGLSLAKIENHRAMDDIYESMEELKGLVGILSNVPTK